MLITHNGQVRFGLGKVNSDRRTCILIIILDKELRMWIFVMCVVV